jgi:HlyD family secretion protein
MKSHPGKIVIGLIVVIALFLLFRTGKKEQAVGTMFVVRQGNLPISVTEGGSVEALESQEIRSEIKGYQGTKILSIVEEGYLVTEEDVKKGKVLVELDSSEIKQKITQQDIQFQSTLASLTEAQQGYEIQYNQNKTDIKAAEQKARFAKMDVEKFLGAQVTKEVLRETGLDMDLLVNDKDTLDFEKAESLAPRLAELSVNKTAADVPIQAVLVNITNTAALLSANSSNLVSALSTNSVSTNDLPVISKPVDFSKYAKLELLGDGEGKQKLRKVEDDLLVAKSEFGVSKNQFDGTQRLATKGFVTRNTLQNEEITVQKNDLKVQTAETSRTLFIKYEFPKTAEELLSKYEEGVRLYERTRKEAISKLAQARAKLKSAEGRYNIEVEQRKDLDDQLQKCTLKAQKTGLVVYGGGNDNNYYYGQEQIREGATIRERQPIITIPDMTKMSAKVKIHESHIKKVKKGMKAKLRVDAFANENLTGEVNKVGVLPDSQNRWMNPDLKVYVTSVKIDGVRDWLKPGMSVKVEVLVTELTNVVYVPIQAVSAEDKFQVCYVVDGSRQEKRVVETGEFNDEFIEIKSGLKAGEKILLRLPASGKSESKPEEKKEIPPPPRPPGQPA